jgi:ABC-2 type transport system ATP-binding protein
VSDIEHFWKKIHEMFSACKLKKQKGSESVYIYLGGMKRRLNLAAGILSKPRPLLLDKPTVGIDAQSRNMILEKLSELKQTRTTMLYTTHYMEEAEQLYDFVAIIDEEQIIIIYIHKGP